MNLKTMAGLLLLVLAACTVTDKNVVTEHKTPLTADKKELRNNFVGKWHSEQPNDTGGTNITTVTRMPDGRYVNEFTVLNASSIIKSQQKEFGFWGVSGGIYFTIFKGWIENDQLVPSDPTDAYNYDSYKILTVKSDELIYKSLSSGNLYTYRKVE